MVLDVRYGMESKYHSVVFLSLDPSEAKNKQGKQKLHTHLN